MSQRAIERLSKCENIVLVGNSECNRLPIISMLLRHGGMFLHHNFVGALLGDLFGIQVRTGCLCAGPYLLHQLNFSDELSDKLLAALMRDDNAEIFRPGVVRVSLPYFLSEHEFEFVMRALEFVGEHGWKLLAQYTFNTETGEWFHFSNRADKDRRWLSSFSFKPKPAEPAEPAHDNSEAAWQHYFQECLSEAARLADAEIERKTTLAHLTDELAALKWFVYPGEAAPSIASSQSACFKPLGSANASASALEAVPVPVPVVEAPKRVLFPPIPKKQLIAPTVRAIKEFQMIREGDRVLLGVSGGKDSLTLLHLLLRLRASLPTKFELAACTIDPMTEAYDPSPLISYMKELGVKYFFESERIIQEAERVCPTSICSWCARMKRGTLYTVARREGYNVLALGQHLDDFAESFIMSIFHNGKLRTMKPCYTVDEGDIRVIRPLYMVRERETRAFAEKHILPVISENCPACFEVPKERKRTKNLLAMQEQLFPTVFSNIAAAMKPLLPDTPEVNRITNKSQ